MWAFAFISVWGSVLMVDPVFNCLVDDNRQTEWTSRHFYFYRNKALLDYPIVILMLCRVYLIWQLCVREIHPLVHSWFYCQLIKNGRMSQSEVSTQESKCVVPAFIFKKEGKMNTSGISVASIVKRYFFSSVKPTGQFVFGTEIHSVNSRAACSVFPPLIGSDELIEVSKGFLGNVQNNEWRPCVRKWSSKSSHINSCETWR